MSPQRYDRIWVACCCVAFASAAADDATKNHLFMIPAALAALVVCWLVIWGQEEHPRG